MTGDALVTYTTRDGLPDNHVNALWEDRDGSLWIGTAKGLVERRGGRFDTYTTRDGLSNNVVTALYEDAGGSLWIGTNGGVSRRRGRGFDRFTAKEGLNYNSVASLTGDREGNLWIGTSGGGLTKLTERSFSTLSRELEHIVEDRTRALREEVSERRRAEDALRRARDEAELANRAKGQFLANMSHEIRTPMNGIIGMTSLALTTPLTAEQREYLDMVRQSADALRSIIDDILDFSKIESGRLELDLAPFALRTTLRETLNPLLLRAREKGLQFTLEIDPLVPDALVGDQGRIRQVVINLVANAIKFTRLGSVTVTVGVDGAQDDDQTVVHFAINDTGIGIAPEKHALIFEPFRQADGSTTREFGGTGLGLAICRTLVEVFGGRLWVESSTSGSTFHFTARLAKTPHARLPAQTAPAARQSRANLNVLPAEDNRINQMLAKRLLERWGHNVVLAETGRQAVAAHAQQKFDVILMDVQMPEMNGFEATAAIRAAEGASRDGTPIVAMTAHAMKGDRERCLAEGMDGYVSKPIDPAALFDAIERVLTSRMSPAPV